MEKKKKRINKTQTAQPSCLDVSIAMTYWLPPLDSALVAFLEGNARVGQGLGDLSWWAPGSTTGNGPSPPAEAVQACRTGWRCRTASTPTSVSSSVYIAATRAGLWDRGGQGSRLRALLAGT